MTNVCQSVGAGAGPAYRRRVTPAARSTARPAARATVVLVAGAAVAVLAAGLGLALVAGLDGQAPAGTPCSGPGDAIALGAPGGGQRVGATEYGGPGDPGSGTVGASGTSLLAHPDSYAELGGITFQTATAMGGLAYMTPVRVTWDGRSAVAYKRDFGLGGGPVAGLPRVIDLWWEFASGAADPLRGRPVVGGGADRPSAR